MGLCQSKRAERAWFSLFFATVWTIWEARNERVFKDTKKDLNQAKDMVCFRVAWWFKNIGNGTNDPITVILLNIADRCVTNKKVKTTNVKAWFPPAPDCLKFNVDGSFRMLNGQAGIGGVLRDSLGKIRCIFSEKVGCCDAISAEIMAIVRACHLCASSPNLKDKRIVFVSDSKEVVSWINSNGVGSWQHMNQIMDIRNLLGVLNQSHVEFNLRDYNTYADGLAKKGADGEGDVLEWSW